MKKQKLKKEQKRKELEAERAKDEQISRKRKREERRERYREQEKSKNFTQKRSRSWLSLLIYFTQHGLKFVHCCWNLQQNMGSEKSLSEEAGAEVRRLPSSNYSGQYFLCGRLSAYWNWKALITISLAWESDRNTCAPTCCFWAEAKFWSILW